MVEKELVNELLELMNNIELVLGIKSEEKGLQRFLAEKIRIFLKEKAGDMFNLKTNTGQKNCPRINLPRIIHTLFGKFLSNAVPERVCAIF